MAHQADTSAASPGAQRGVVAVWEVVDTEVALEMLLANTGAYRKVVLVIDTAAILAVDRVVAMVVAPAIVRRAAQVAMVGKGPVMAVVAESIEVIAHTDYS